MFKLTKAMRIAIVCGCSDFRYGPFIDKLIPLTEEEGILLAEDIKYVSDQYEKFKSEGYSFSVSLHSARAKWVENIIEGHPF